MSSGSHLDSDTWASQLFAVLQKHGLEFCAHADRESSSSSSSVDIERYEVFLSLLQNGETIVQRLNTLLERGELSGHNLLRLLNSGSLASLGDVAGGVGLGSGGYSTSVSLQQNQSLFYDSSSDQKQLVRTLVRESI